MQLSSKLVLAAIAVILIAAGCRRLPGSLGGGLTTPPATPPPAIPPASINPVPTGITLTKITDQGGRVDWYHGNSQLIAYDAIVNSANQVTELFIINPDGTGKVCVTCNAPIPKGFTGQPAWHPDGEHLVIQAENSNSQHGLYNHMGWGFDEDLWIINKDGTGAQKIWSTPKGGAALHPHFSSDGKKLIFSERVPGGVNLGWRFYGPDGENPWINWQIHIADVDLGKTGTAILSNDKILYGGTGNLYETHGFTSGDRRIVFTMTKNGGMYEDDVYTAKLDGSDMVNLTNSPATWDELGNFSPSGKSLAFISSRADTSWVAPGSKPNALRTELYIDDIQTGKITQLTNFNKDMGNIHYLVSDFDWNRTGNQIIFQVAPFAGTTFQSPQIWLLTFPSPQ